MRYLLILSMFLFLGCGPSAEEKAFYERAKSDPGLAVRVKVRFTSGAVDTLTAHVTGKLQLSEDNLVDHRNGCCDQDIIARHVDAFSIVE